MSDGETQTKHHAGEYPVPFLNTPADEAMKVKIDAARRFGLFYGNYLKVLCVHELFR